MPDMFMHLTWKSVVCKAQEKTALSNTWKQQTNKTKEWGKTMQRVMQQISAERDNTVNIHHVLSHLLLGDKLWETWHPRWDTFLKWCHDQNNLTYCQYKIWSTPTITLRLDKRETNDHVTFFRGLQVIQNSKVSQSDWSSEIFLWNMNVVVYERSETTANTHTTADSQKGR